MRVVAVVSDVALGEGPDAGCALLASGGALALADAGHRIGQHLRGQAGVDDSGVGDGPGHSQGARPLGGHGDRYGGVSPAHVGLVAPVLAGLPGQHLADGLDIVMQLRQPCRTQPQVQHRAVAAAEAQEGATAGKLVNRGYGGGGHRRVTSQGIADRRPQHHPLGRRGHNARVTYNSRAKDCESAMPT